MFRNNAIYEILTIYHLSKNRIKFKKKEEYSQRSLFETLTRIQRASDKIKKNYLTVIRKNRK